MLHAHHDPLRARMWRVVLILVAIFWTAVVYWLVP